MAVAMGGDMAELIEHRTKARQALHRTVTPLTQVRFPGAAMVFLPRVNFQCRLSFGVRTRPCATTCIHISAHVKDPVVHVRVRWIMATQTYSAGPMATKTIDLMIVVAQ